MQSARSLAMRRALAQAGRGPVHTATSSPAAVLARRSVSHITASTSPSSATTAHLRPITPSRRTVAPHIRHGSSAPSEPLAKTPLYDLHLAHGAKMVPFGGFHMPVQYDGLSVSQSHAFTREHSSIFDVSHMVQRLFAGPGAAAFLERLTPSGLHALPVHRSTLSTLLHADGSGGIVDDTIITRLPDGVFYVVTNAACRAKDDAYLSAELTQWNDDPAHGSLQTTQSQLPTHGLIALQGPDSAAILASLLADDDDVDLTSLYFGHSLYARLRLPSGDSSPLLISRGGYTGEDGFEISIPGPETVPVTSALLAAGGPSRVQLAGLGARDSLRLEAGMCLYGHDLDDTTTPVEAGLSWIVPKDRRAPDAGYYGADVISKQLVARSKGGAGVARRRVGLVVEGAPAREGAEIVGRGEAGDKVGVVTSGCPSPTLGRNIAMGYVRDGMHKAGTEVDVLVRGKPRKATVVKMPFVEAKYYKGA